MIFKLRRAISSMYCEMANFYVRLLLSGVICSQVCLNVMLEPQYRAPDPGFQLLFTTNLKEVSEEEIQFEKPLPKWLRGTLIRNGLGRFELGHRSVKRAFDGFSKLFAWKFYGNGTATFLTKFLMSEFYNASLTRGDIAPYLMFEGVEPPFGELEKIQALIHGIDNMNVNNYDFYNSFENRSEYMAVNDFWKIYQINPHDLTTIGPITAPLPVTPGHRGCLGFLSSAHPLPESGTDYHLTFLSSVSLIPGIKGQITLVRIKSAEVREEVATWPVDKLPYMHSFSVSPNYAILFASPFYINVLEMLRYAEPIDGMDWYPGEQTTVYVINLKTGAVKTLKTENMFCLHHINAYEETNGRIIIDIASYESPEYIKSLELKNLIDIHKRNAIPTKAMLKRYTIDLETETVAPQHFISFPGKEFVLELDMPTINENYRFSKHCFVYGMVLKSDRVHFSNITLVKKNVCRNDADQVWYIPNHYPMEAWFVPIPVDHSEDDGYLMTHVLDGPNEQSYLVVIDAKTMTTVNKAALPVVVPFTLHGRFFKDVF